MNRKKFLCLPRRLILALVIIVLVIIALAGCPHPATSPPSAITVAQVTGGSFTVKAGDAEAVSSSTEAEEGTTITLTATAASGYRFKKWTVTGATLSSDTSNPATFTMPAGAVTVTAEFEEHNVGSPIVSVSVWVNEDDGTILVSDDDITFSGDDPGEVVVTVNEEYGGVTWYVNGMSVSSEAERSFTINPENYPEGKYILGVRVTKDGIPYSTDIRFIKN